MHPSKTVTVNTADDPRLPLGNIRNRLLVIFGIFRVVDRTILVNKCLNLIFAYRQVLGHSEPVLLLCRRSLNFAKLQRLKALLADGVLVLCAALT